MVRELVDVRTTGSRIGAGGRGQHDDLVIVPEGEAEERWRRAGLDTGMIRECEGESQRRDVATIRFRWGSG
jgi:hypothetical protein